MENKKRPEDGPIETLQKLLNIQDFVGAKYVVEMNKLVRNKRSELDQALAISDVLLAAKNRLPNGFMDYYAMLRVTRYGPVVLEDFKMIMKLLDGRHNHFSYSQEAAQHVLQAWSMLSKPHMKAKYDLALMQYEKKEKKEKHEKEEKEEKKKSTRNRKRVHWKPSEDLKLRELVEAFGPQNWKYIAEKIQGRTNLTCRARWYNYLDPRINKAPFSDEEYQKLLEAHRLHGNKWSKIGRLFYGRPEHVVKKHWHLLMKKTSREQLALASSEEEIQ